MMDSFEALAAKVEESNRDLSEIFLAEEMVRTSRDEADLLATMEESWDRAKKAIRNGLAADRAAEGALGGNSRRVWRRVETHDTFAGDFVGKLVAYAIAAVEEKVRLAEFLDPHGAAAAGVLPSFFMALEEENGVPEDRLLRGFMVAAGIGRIAAGRGGAAHPAVAAAMAAGAGCFLVGGNVTQSLSAVGLALAHGQAGVFDAGDSRPSAFGVMAALTAFELAMANVKSPASPDALVDALVAARGDGVSR